MLKHRPRKNKNLKCSSRGIVPRGGKCLKSPVFGTPKMVLLGLLDGIPRD